VKGIGKEKIWSLNKAIPVFEKEYGKSAWHAK